MSVLTSAVEANTQYESFQRLTLSENLGSRAMSMSEEHLQSSSPDYEIPMLHNPQSMNIMQSEPWTYLDEIKPANRRTACCYRCYHINPIPKKLRDIKAV
ncbi:hypothetical protein DPMN_033349 [Dreissena polymorpha]|uniref:Uncharacterized protein n=1 Tax=Dreissena polymorpha TaxID=45954 RepID=A0A9D4RKW0_DREPO|nr:hypothetical protein DPMN_033349 [Dreissena polymorpha]